jgi:hypothetical protein
MIDHTRHGGDWQTYAPRPALTKALTFVGSHHDGSQVTALERAAQLRELGGHRAQKRGGRTLAGSVSQNRHRNGRDAPSIANSSASGAGPFPLKLTRW